MVKCESLRINMFRITHTGKSINFPVTKHRVCRIWTKRYPNSCKSLFLVEMRTAANALNWKLNGTTSSMSCLTGVRTIRLFLRLLQLPKNGPLQRFLRHKESYRRSYPLLLQVAEICLSIPVSNTWPERGGQCPKAPKNTP